MRTLAVVLLMTCVCACYANPAQISSPKEKPQMTRKVVVVKEAAVAPRASQPTPSKTIIIKKKAPKRKICKRYHKDGPYYCEEQSVPKKVIVRRVYAEDDVEMLLEEEVRPRRARVVAPARVYHQPVPFGMSFHFRLP